MTAAKTFSRLALGLSVVALPAALMIPAFAGGGAKSGAASQEEQIKAARSAAPRAISKDATVAVNEGGKLRVLHQGTNTWTCMPEMMESPSPNPVCVDKVGLEWINAYLERKDPPADRVGIAYMLAGGSDASNTDPFAMAPATGKDWIKTGPHIMILGARSTMKEGLSAAVPSDKAKPDTSRPYVMWSGTPYEHVMIPIE